MRPSDIEAFFTRLESRISFPIQVLLTGGAAAAIFGGSRATEDIDFEVHLKVGSASQAEAWNELQAQLTEVARLTRIKPEFSEDIDRWSAIALPEKKSRLWLRIGKIEIRVLDPDLWAVGKLTRYLAPDQKDLVGTFQRVKSDPRKLARLWGRALGISPASSAQSSYRQHVQQFFETHAVKLWGKSADPKKLMDLFLTSARKATKK